MRKSWVKKGLVCGIIVLMLEVSVVPGMSRSINLVSSMSRIINQNYELKILGDDEIDQNQSQWNGNSGGRQFTWAQSFKPTMPILTRIKIMFFTEWSTKNIYSLNPLEGNITISINDSLYSDPLAVVTIPGADLPGYGNWLEWNFSDLNVTPEKTYYICVIANITGGPSGLDIAWGDYSNVYSRGEAYDYNGVWQAQGNDRCFQTYGRLTENQQQTQFNKNLAFYSTHWNGQSFIPIMTTMTHAKVYICKARNPTSDVVLSIRSSRTGPDLASVSKPASQIPTTNAWIDFDFSDLAVTPGNIYYLVLKTTGGNNKNCYYWGYGTDTPYTDGMRWTSNNAGSKWTSFAKNDFCFKIYGI